MTTKLIRWTPGMDYIPGTDIIATSIPGVERIDRRDWPAIRDALEKLQGTTLDKVTFDFCRVVIAHIDRAGLDQRAPF